MPRQARLSLDRTQGPFRHLIPVHPRDRDHPVLAIDGALEMSVASTARSAGRVENQAAPDGVVSGHLPHDPGQERGLGDRHLGPLQDAYDLSDPHLRLRPSLAIHHAAHFPLPRPASPARPGTTIGHDGNIQRYARRSSSMFHRFNFQPTRRITASYSDVPDRMRRRGSLSTFPGETGDDGDYSCKSISRGEERRKACPNVRLRTTSPPPS